MRRKVWIGAIACALLGLLVVVLGGDATGAAERTSRGLHGEVWVTNKTLNNVAVFDASNGHVRGIVAVGKTPIGVIVPVGSRNAYVSNEGSNTVSVIDRKSLSVIKTISMGPGPHHMMASPDGKRLYVGEYNANTVGVIDTTTDVEIARYVTSSNPAAKTHAVFVSRDGSTLYATNFATDELVVLDARTGGVEWKLALDGGPSEALLGHDGKTLYVSIRTQDSVAVVDLAAQKVIAEPWIGSMPDTLAMTPNGKDLVVTLRGNPAQISLLDTRSLSATLINLNGSTTGHHWLSASGRYSFVAVEGPGSLAVVDNQTAQTTATFAYPGDGKPHGVFFEPSGDDLSSSD